MDRNSALYQLAVMFVSLITFLFVLFVLPNLPPHFIIPILTGMIILMGISFVIRYRRMKGQIPQKEDLDHSSSTKRYIEQIDALMSDKK
ncbi:MAG: hypothetical protein ACFFE8_05865 [Candidatus Heimdallarchaeota archaeon]